VDLCKWAFERRKDGTYIIKTVHNRYKDKAIIVPVNKSKDDKKLATSDITAQPNQLWRVRDVGAGYYTFINVETGRVIDIPNNSTVDSIRIIHWESNNGDGQKFKFEKVKK